MSLTQNITSLTGQVTDLTARVASWIDQADAKIQQALHQIPELAVSYYVDQAAGDDAAAGTVDAPLASIEEAISRIGPTRYGEIWLKSDYTLTTHRIYTQHNTALLVRGYGQSRRLELGLHAVGSLYDGYDYEVGGLMTGGSRGTAVFCFADLNIVWPSAPASGAVMPDIYSALVGSWQQDGPPLLAVELVRCNLEYPADGVGCVLGAAYRASALALKTCTYDAARMAGHWIAGVAAGTATTSVPHVISNLSTL